MTPFLLNSGKREKRRRKGGRKVREIRAPLLKRVGRRRCRLSFIRSVPSVISLSEKDKSRRHLRPRRE